MDPVQKVSMNPRGVGALGYTMQRPTEDGFLLSRSDLENRLTVLLGLRAAALVAQAWRLSSLERPGRRLGGRAPRVANCSLIYINTPFEPRL